MAGLTLESALLAAIVLVLVAMLSLGLASRPASAVPGSNARYTESLATALAPAWSAGRRIEWRGSETYRFANPLRQRLDLLEANYEILLDGFPRSGNTPAAKYIETSQIGRVAARTRYHISGALKTVVGLSKPAVCPIRNPEEAVLSWTIFRRRPLVDPAFRSYVEYHTPPHNVPGDLFIVPFEAIFHRMPVVVEAVSVRDRLCDRGL